MMGDEHGIPNGHIPLILEPTPTSNEPTNFYEATRTYPSQPLNLALNHRHFDDFCERDDDIKQEDIRVMPDADAGKLLPSKKGDLRLSPRLGLPQRYNGKEWRFLCSYCGCSKHVKKQHYCETHLKLKLKDNKDTEQKPACSVEQAINEHPVLLQQSLTLASNTKLDLDQITEMFKDISTLSKAAILYFESNLNMFYGVYSEEKKNRLKQLHEHLMIHSKTFFEEVLKESLDKDKHEISKEVDLLAEKETLEVKNEMEENTTGLLNVYTSNHLCCIKLRAVPLPSAATHLLEKSTEILRVLSDRQSENIAVTLEDVSKSFLITINMFKLKLQEALGDSIDVSQIWAVGPRKCGLNILLNKVPNNTRSFWKPENSSNTLLAKYEKSFVEGFQRATMIGPLCKEPMMGVCFVVEDWTIDVTQQTLSDPYGSMYVQIMSAVSDGCQRIFQAYKQHECCS